MEIEPYEWCDSIVLPPDITHTPQVSMTLGPNNYWTQGEPECPDCYLSAEGDGSIDNATSGEEYELSWDADVVCSLAGEFFNSNGYLGVAIATTTYNLTTVNANGTVTFTQACPGTSRPSCGARNLLGSQPTIWAEEFQLKVTIGGSGPACFPVSIVQYFNGQPAPYPCT